VPAERSDESGDRRAASSAFTLSSSARILRAASTRRDVVLSPVVLFIRATVLTQPLERLEAPLPRGG